MARFGGHKKEYAT